MTSPLLPVALSLLLSAIAATTDVRHTRIPNWLTVSSMLAGLTLGALRGGSLGLLGSALGLVLCAAVPVILFASTRGRAMGGGDVKALAAVGALLGPTRGLEVEMTALSVVAFVSLASLSLRGQLAPVLQSSWQLAFGWLGRKTRAPKERDRPALTPVKLGPALCAACVLCASANAGPLLRALS